MVWLWFDSCYLLAVKKNRYTKQSKIGTPTMQINILSRDKLLHKSLFFGDYLIIVII